MTILTTSSFIFFDDEIINYAQKSVDFMNLSQNVKKPNYIAFPFVNCKIGMH